MADDDEKIRAQVNYVDGTFAFIKDIIPNIPITENGITKMKHAFFLTPTPRTKKKWNLKQKKEQDFVEVGKYSGYYKKLYLAELCQILDPSPKSVWLFHCDWHGIPIDIFKGQLTIWRNLLNSRETEIQSLTNDLKRLRYKMRMKSKNFIVEMQREANDYRKFADKIGGATIVSQGEQQNATGPT